MGLIEKQDANEVSWRQKKIQAKEWFECRVSFFAYQMAVRIPVPRTILVGKNKPVPQNVKSMLPVWVKPAKGSLSIFCNNMDEVRIAAMQMTEGYQVQEHLKNCVFYEVEYTPTGRTFKRKTSKSGDMLSGGCSLDNEEASKVLLGVGKLTSRINASDIQRCSSFRLTVAIGPGFIYFMSYKSMV